MGALSKSLSPFYRATSFFIFRILPGALRFLVVIFFVLWTYYMRRRSKRKYKETIDRKSSRFIYRRRMNSESKDLLDCSICLSEFSDGEVGRELPCKHVFHKNCLDTWLHGSRPPTCPVCRRSVLPEEVVWEYNFMQDEEIFDCCFDKELAIILLAAVNGRSCHRF